MAALNEILEELGQAESENMWLRTRARQAGIVDLSHRGVGPIPNALVDYILGAKSTPDEELWPHTRHEFEECKLALLDAPKHLKTQSEFMLVRYEEFMEMREKERSGRKEKW